MKKTHTRIVSNVIGVRSLKMYLNTTKINVLWAARARNPPDLTSFSCSHITARALQREARSAPTVLSENEVRTDGALSQEILWSTGRWIEHASSSCDTSDPVRHLGAPDLNVGQETPTIIHRGFLGPPPSFQVKLGTVPRTRSRLFPFQFNTTKHLLFDENNLSCWQHS